MVVVPVALEQVGLAPEAREPEDPELVAPEPVALELVPEFWVAALVLESQRLPA